MQSRPSQKQAAFDSFNWLCTAHGLRKRPVDLKEGDATDGVNDEATLLYVSLLIPMAVVGLLFSGLM